MQFFHTSFALLQIDYEIKWSIKAKGHAFSSGGRACDLCLTEKLVILTSDQNSTWTKEMNCWKYVMSSFWRKKYVILWLLYTKCIWHWNGYSQISSNFQFLIDGWPAAVTRGASKLVNGRIVNIWFVFKVWCVFK